MTDLRVRKEISIAKGVRAYFFGMQGAFLITQFVTHELWPLFGNVGALAAALATLVVVPEER